MTSEHKINVGFLSTASITHSILDALTYVDGVQCNAIASRSLERAEEYAKKHGIDNACTYDQLLSIPNQAIYIPLPTALATEWAVRSAKAGKHILVDKPFASAQDLEAIKTACEQAKVIFLDGTHFVHSARTTELKRRIAAGDIGRLRRVHAMFCIPVTNLKNGIRSKTSLEPMTSWGDLGWYVCRAAVTFLGVEKASKILSIKCTSKMHDHFPEMVQKVEGSIEFGTCEKDKISLTFLIDGTSSAIQRLLIMGDEANLEVDGYIAPPAQTNMYSSLRKAEEFTTDVDYVYDRSVSSIDGYDGYHWCYPRREIITVKEENKWPQTAMMIKEFARMIQENDLETSNKWITESITTQRIVDAVYEHIMQNHSK